MFHTFRIFDSVCKTQTSLCLSWFVTSLYFSCPGTSPEAGGLKSRVTSGDCDLKRSEQVGFASHKPRFAVQGTLLWWVLVFLRRLSPTHWLLGVTIWSFFSAGNNLWKLWAHICQGHSEGERCRLLLKVMGSSQLPFGVFLKERLSSREEKGKMKVAPEAGELVSVVHPVLLLLRTSKTLTGWSKLGIKPRVL